MKVGVVVLLVGFIIVMAAVGILAFSMKGVGNIEKKVSVEPNQTRVLKYNIHGENYTLVIRSNIKINYTLSNSSGNILEENNVTEDTHVLGNLKGNFTLKIENPENSTAQVVVVFESQEKLLSLGKTLLESSGVCITGIIVIVAGIIVLLRERKKR